MDNICRKAVTDLFPHERYFERRNGGTSKKCRNFYFFFFPFSVEAKFLRFYYFQNSSSHRTNFVTLLECYRFSIVLIFLSMYFGVMSLLDYWEDKVAFSLDFVIFLVCILCGVSSFFFGLRRVKAGSCKDKYCCVGMCQLLLQEICVVFPVLVVLCSQVYLCYYHLSSYENSTTTNNGDYGFKQINFFYFSMFIFLFLRVRSACFVFVYSILLIMFLLLNFLTPTINEVYFPGNYYAIQNLVLKQRIGYSCHYIIFFFFFLSFLLFNVELKYRKIFLEKSKLDYYEKLYRPKQVLLLNKLCRNVNFNDLIVPEEYNDRNQLHFYDIENQKSYTYEESDTGKKTLTNQIRTIQPETGVCVMKVELDFDGMDQSNLLSFEDQRLLRTKIFCYFDILSNHFKYVKRMTSNQINFSSPENRKNTVSGSKRRNNNNNSNNPSSTSKKYDSLKCAYYCYSYYGNERKLEEAIGTNLGRVKMKKVMNQLIVLAFLFILKLHQKYHKKKKRRTNYMGIAGGRDNMKHSAVHKLILPKIRIKIGHFRNLYLVTNPKRKCFMFPFDEKCTSFKKKFDFDLSVPSKTPTTRRRKRSNKNNNNNNGEKEEEEEEEEDVKNMIIVDKKIYNETNEFFDYSFVFSSRGQGETYFFTDLLRKNKKMILNTSLIDLFNQFYALEIKTQENKEEKEKKSDSEEKSEKEEKNEEKEEEEEEEGGGGEEEERREKLHFNLIPNQKILKKNNIKQSIKFLEDDEEDEFLSDDHGGNNMYDDESYYSDTDSESSFGHIVRNSQKKKMEERKKKKKARRSKDNNVEEVEEEEEEEEEEKLSEFDPDELKKIKLFLHNRREVHRSLYPIDNNNNNNDNSEHVHRGPHDRDLESEEENEYPDEFTKRVLEEDEDGAKGSILYRRRRRTKNKKWVYPFFCCFSPVTYYFYCCCCFCSPQNWYSYFCVNDILSYYKYNLVKKIQKKKYQFEHDHHHHQQYLHFYYYNYWYFRPFQILSVGVLGRKLILKFEYVGLVVIKSIVFNVLLSLYFIGFYFFILYSEDDHDGRITSNGSVSNISVNSFMIFNYTNLGIQLLYSGVVYVFLSTSMFHKVVIWCCCWCCKIVNGTFRIHSIVKILRKLTLRVMIILYPILQLTMYLCLLVTLFFSNNLQVDDDEGYNNPNLTIQFFMEILFLLFFMEILQGQVNHNCVHLKLVQMFFIFIPLKFLFYVFVYIYYQDDRSALSTTDELFFLKEYRFFWWEHFTGYYLILFPLAVILLEVLKISRWESRQSMHEIEEEVQRFQMIQNEILVNLVGITQVNYNSQYKEKGGEGETVTSITEHESNNEDGKKKNKKKKKKKKEDFGFSSSNNEYSNLLSRVMDFEMEQILGSSCQSFLNSKYSDTSSLFVEERERNLRVGCISLHIDTYLSKKMDIISELRKNIIEFTSDQSRGVKKTNFQLSHYSQMQAEYREENQNVIDFLSSVVTFISRVEDLLSSPVSRRNGTIDNEIEVLNGIMERTSDLVFFSKYISFRAMFEISVEIVHLFQYFRFLSNDPEITTTTTTAASRSSRRREMEEKELKGDVFLKIGLLKNAGLEFNFIQSGGRMEYLRYDVLGSAFSNLQELMGRGVDLIRKNSKKKFAYNLSKKNKKVEKSNTSCNNAIFCFRGDYMKSRLHDGCFIEEGSDGEKRKIRMEVILEGEEKKKKKNIQEEIVVIGEDERKNREIVAVKIFPKEKRKSRVK